MQQETLQMIKSALSKTHQLANNSLIKRLSFWYENKITDSTGK